MILKPLRSLSAVLCVLLLLSACSGSPAPPKSSGGVSAGSSFSSASDASSTSAHSSLQSAPASSTLSGGTKEGSGSNHSQSKAASAGSTASAGRQETAVTERWKGPLTIGHNGSLRHAYGAIQLKTESGEMQNSARKVLSGSHTQMNVQETPGKLEITQSWSNAQLRTVAKQESFRTVLTQYAQNTQGISSVSFELTVADSSDIIIPAWGGIRLTKSTPDIHLGFERLSYPDLWQAQMLLIQNRDGGLLIYADDDGTQFKALTVKHKENSFQITIETVPQAPFDNIFSFETVKWNMVPYRGGWEQGALIYKDYADQKFLLNKIDDKKPAWAKNVGLVVLTDIEDSGMLVELSKVVDPSKTLLHVPGWRQQGYDIGYPDYTPNDQIKSRIALAKRLGFRVGLHFNMIGAEVNSAEYKSNLKDVHSLNAFTKELIFERYTAFGKNYVIAQINQASRVWQKILAKKAVEAAAELGFDVIHLDQSFLCFNDGRGLVDGMTSMQGNVALQKELASTLPKIAFSGEGINELNVRYASFLQMHVYGVNSSDKTWDSSRFSQIVPLADLLFGDAMAIYHYPAMPNPAVEPEYYNAWREAGRKMGIIPTIMRVSALDLSRPNAAVKQALEDAKRAQNIE